MRQDMSVKEAKEILGLSGDFDENDVRKAFRDKVKKYHPDLCAHNGISPEEAEAKMVKLNKAKDTLDKAMAMGTLYDEPVVTYTTVNAGAAHTTANAEQEAAAEPEPTRSAYTTSATAEAAEPSAAETPVNKARTEIDWDSSLLYTILGRFPYFIVFLIAGWTLPFYVFGGLNLMPQWHGLIEPTGMDFLVFYLVVPFAALVNFLVPFHPLDWFIHKVSCGLYKAIRGAVHDMQT